MTQVSSSSQQSMISKTDEDMRNAVMERIPEQLQPYLEGIDRIWDRELIIRTNIERLGYKDIILKPVIDIFGDIVYKSYCKLNSLATQLGYSRTDALFASNNLLDGASKYYLKDLNTTIKTLDYRVPCKSIIPLHLNDKTDRNRNNYVYINMDTAYTLINGALRRTKMKDKAKMFDEALKLANMISTSLITKLTKLCDEYKIKQLEADQKRLELYDKQKQALDNALQIAIERIKDVELSKKYHMYIFTTKAQEVHMKYKFGITDDLSKRLISLQNGDQTDGGKYVHQVEVYNNRWSERLLHQILKDVGLHCDGEWYMTPGEEPSIKLLDTLASSVNDTYDVAIEFPALIRNRLKEQLSIDYSPTPTIMPPPIMVVDEAKLVNDFIKDVANKVGADKPIYKTHLLKILRELANDDRYKKHKDKLPTNFDRFANTTDDGINTNGIKIETKSAGRQTTIRFIIEIITTD